MRNTIVAILFFFACAAFANDPTAPKALGLRDEVDAQLNRLEYKYVGNRSMLSSINRLRSTWKSYIDAQCHFETLAAAGGEEFIKAPPGVRSAQYACFEKMTLELKARLEKF